MLFVEMVVDSLNLPWRPPLAFSNSSIFAFVAITVKCTVVSVWFSLKSVISLGVFSVPVIIPSRKAL